MSHDDFWLWLNNNIFQAGMNVEYHQTIAWWYWAAQSAATVAVVALAIGGIALAAKKKFEKWSWRLGVFGGLATCAALVFPLSNWQSQAERFSCEWSAIRGTLDGMEQQYKAAPKYAPLPQSLCDDMRLLDARKGQLQASEPAPWPSLLKRAYGDQVERMHGPGIRTAEQVREQQMNAKASPIEQPGRPAPPA